jgi:hypothetical protein
MKAIYYLAPKRASLALLLNCHSCLHDLIRLEQNQIYLHSTDPSVAKRNDAERSVTHVRNYKGI